MQKKTVIPFFTNFILQKLKIREKMWKKIKNEQLLVHFGEENLKKLNIIFCFHIIEK